MSLDEVADARRVGRSRAPGRRASRAGSGRSGCRVGRRGRRGSRRTATRSTSLYRACWRLGAIAVAAAPPGRSRRRRAPARGDHAEGRRRSISTRSPTVHRSPTCGPTRRQRAACCSRRARAGAPKGVLHTQATLAYKALQMAQVHELTPDDCVLMPAPSAHISGLLERHHVAGRRAVPHRVHGEVGSGDALELIERERVTFMIGPPTFFVSMMQSPAFTPARVASPAARSRAAAPASAQAFVDEATAAFGARVKRTYGSTEAPTVITDGRPIGDVELRIDDNGELLVRGPELCRRLPRRRADRGRVHRRRLVPHRRPRDDRPTAWSRSSGA